jgi:hypothetical protein
VQSCEQHEHKLHFSGCVRDPPDNERTRHHRADGDERYHPDPTAPHGYPGYRATRQAHRARCSGGAMRVPATTRRNPRTLAAFRRALAKAQRLIAGDPPQARDVCCPPT